MSVQFVCHDTLWELIGPETIACNSSGYYSVEQPTCKKRPVMENAGKFISKCQFFHSSFLHRPGLNFDSIFVINFLYGTWGVTLTGPYTTYI